MTRRALTAFAAAVVAVPLLAAPTHAEGPFPEGEGGPAGAGRVSRHACMTSGSPIA